MPTTSTAYGRAGITWPDMGHDAGTALHQKVVGTFGDKYGIETVSDYLPDVWYTVTALGAAATQNIVHNFSLSYTSNELKVLIWISDVLQTKDQIDATFTIAQVNANTISITNATGSPVTFKVMVFALPIAHYIQKILQAYQGAGFGIDTDEAGVLPIGHTIATDVDLGRSGQYQSAKGLAALTVTTDSATTGSNATLAALTTSFVRLTNASLTSVDMIPAPTKPTILVLTNTVGGSVNFNNETGATAANRILTGTGATLAVANNGSLWLVYDLTSSRWRVIGGSGGGSYAVKALQSISSGGTIALGSEGLQTIRVQGNAAPFTASATPFGTTPPTDGTMIVLLGADSTNTIKLVHNDATHGCWLNGDCEIGKGTSLKLQYISAIGRYVEIVRNGILGL